MVPVTTSKAKSQAGFDVSGCLGTSLVGLCFGLTPGWPFEGGAPATENKEKKRSLTKLIRIEYQKSIKH